MTHRYFALLNPNRAMSPCKGKVWGIVFIACTLAMAGCASNRSVGSAPVEDRGTMVGRPVPNPSPAVAAPAPHASETNPNATAPAVKLPPGQENAGKPGYYTIRPGDTLIRIGLEAGQSWRDIARWNSLDNPNLIEVGQVIRIVAPGVAASAGAPVSDAVVSRPVNTPAPVAAANVAPPGTRTAAPAGAASAPTPAAPPVASAALPPASSPSDEDVGWIWPITGGSSNVVATFDEVKSKGVGIGGKLGDPVLAAGDGRVVYAGAGLRGYGNLVILKHNATYLTAYAHNQTLLVKEDQAVRKGQKIAEMGNSDADRVKLHFEIRRQGKPIDPLRLLPAR
jgi:lipoprotein NlpD